MPDDRSLSLRLLCLLPLAAGCGLLGSTAPGDHSARFALDDFTVPPGGEVFMCRYVPPTGEEAWLRELHANLGAGGHHLLVYRIDTLAGSPDEGQRPCNQLDTPRGADALLFASQESIAGLPLPDGVAMHVTARHGLFLQAHFLNASAQAITAHAEFGWETVDRSSVKTLAGELFFDDKQLTVPPGVSTQGRSCPVKADATLLLTTGHMHRRGTAFDAFLDESPIYHGDTWDSPVARVYPAPGLALARGQTLRWSCRYDNQTGAPVRYGNSALSDEMCILGGVYFPAADGAESTWLCP